MVGGIYIGKNPKVEQVKRTVANGIEGLAVFSLINELTKEE